MVLNNPNVITNLNVRKNLLSSRNVNNPSYKDNQVNIPIAKTYSIDTNEYDLSLTSNTMINCDNVNVINLSFRTTNTDESGGQSLGIGVYYNSIDDFETADLVYQTEHENSIDSYNFFNQFPKRNKFIYFKALNITSNISIEGQVELSKYTQFTTNSQIRDRIDINAQTNLNRDVNDYYTDVINLKVGGELIYRKSGFLENYPSYAGETIIGTGLITEPGIWSLVGATGEDLVNVTSDFAGDNALVSVGGLDTTGNSVVNVITLSGTSNVTSTSKFKMVDFLTSSGIIQGNVSVKTVTGGELLNRLSVNYNQPDNIIQGVPVNHESVIKYLKINSLIDLRGAEIRLNRRVTLSFSSKKDIIQSWHITDSVFDISLDVIGEPIYGQSFIFVSVVHPIYNVLYNNYINCSIEMIQRQLDPIYKT